MVAGEHNLGFSRGYREAEEALEHRPLGGLRWQLGVSTITCICTSTSQQGESPCFEGYIHRQKVSLIFLQLCMVFLLLYNTFINM